MRKRETQRYRQIERDMEKGRVGERERDRVRERERER